MKAKLVLTPLAMAMAAVLSVAAYADQGGEGKGKDDHHHQQHHQQPSIPDWLKGGATATVTDAQYNHGNQVTNKGTQNNASANGSIGGVSGNVGANVAAGDNNQQANAVALATADESFVFGYANASTSVTQQAYNNKLDNYSTANNASLNNSLQGISGNFGVNVAAGNYNQQKNDMAAAVSNGQYTSAAGSATQTSNGNVTTNNSTVKTEYVQVGMGFVAGGGYKGISDQHGDTYLDTWSGETHPGGSNTGHIDVDSQAQGASDRLNNGGALSFDEVGTIGLAGFATGYIPVVSGFNKAVVNNASLNGSIIGVSGNVGVNVAAGGGNQQTNSLSIGAGCSLPVPASRPSEWPYRVPASAGAPSNDGTCRHALSLCPDVAIADRNRRRGLPAVRCVAWRQPRL